MWEEERGVWEEEKIEKIFRTFKLKIFSIRLKNFCFFEFSFSFFNGSERSKKKVKKQITNRKGKELHNAKQEK